MISSARTEDGNPRSGLATRTVKAKRLAAWSATAQGYREKPIK
jgi:hypothetical protein